MLHIIKSLTNKIQHHFNYQKILGVAVFVVFFIGVAALCVQQFPSINRYVPEEESEGTTHINSILDTNKANARSSNNKMHHLNDLELFRYLQGQSSSFVESLHQTQYLVQKNKDVVTHQTRKSMRIAQDQDGYWHRISLRANLQNVVNSTDNLASLAKKQGSKLFFVQMPISFEENTKFPFGIFDASWQQTSSVINRLRKLDINVIDLRKTLTKEDVGVKNAAELFYSNDHHWRPEVAQLAAEQTVNASRSYLNYSYADFFEGFSGKCLDHNNYTYETKKDYFSGSFTRLFGEEKFAKSDFTIIKPLFDTSYKLTPSSLDYSHEESSTTISGNMTKAVFNPSGMKSSQRCNSAYLRLMNSSVNIKNELANNNKKTLVISNSQGHSYTAFLSQFFSQTTFVDCQQTIHRYNVASLLENGSYDAVYILSSPSLFARSDFWKFGMSD